MNLSNVSLAAALRLLVVLAMSAGALSCGKQAASAPPDPTCTDGAKNADESDVDCGGAVCTLCAEGKACAAATDCASGVCTAGACGAASCTDGVKNGDEVGADCGGSCPACADGTPCGAAKDCRSGVCESGACVAASCADGVLNGGESDVDCGGPCPACPAGKGCTGPTDCADGVCTGGACVAASCSDKVRNGKETDVDCGGGCAPCVDGGKCAAPTDCASGICANGVCAPATCGDKVKNGDETDVDCGGQCADCAPGKGCSVAGDCDSGICDAKICASPSCTDKVKNGLETDVDCGGTGGCPACADLRKCTGAADCASGVCTSGACVAAACGDGVKNGDETDVDCGGKCSPCAPGKSCSVPGDCDSGICDAKSCAAPSCTDKVKNGDETDVDCGGTAGCPKCADQRACMSAADCASGVCGTNGLCLAAACADKVKNGSETDVDCGGSCSPCTFKGACTANADCDSGLCTAGVCDCAAGFADCDGAVANGCEVPLNTLTDCGACGQACARTNAKATCASGTCAVDTCNAGFGNCDATDANGCETALNSLTNCGACGTACSRTNASATCASGSCAIDTCSAGFANCDGNDANGCETPLDTLTDCAACGMSCSRTNATASCGTGSCSIASCNALFGNCDSADPNGCETPLNTLTDCGACGTSCSRTNATATCGSGTCAVAACMPGYGNCDGSDADGCETSLTTLNDCGACGTGCARTNATATCTTGSCAIDSCSLGFGDCDNLDQNGCETPLNLLTDCGRCGAACSRANATATCGTGSCAISACDSGFGDCDTTDSNGCETPLNTLTNCGGCGTACARANATATCAGGVCGISACTSGFGNCNNTDADGCEKPLNTLTDCGGCGVSCARTNASATCSTGSCAIASCSSGFGNCNNTDSDGCEKPLNTLTDCGGCGVTCSRTNASATCSTGSCAIASCSSGFGNCNNTDSDGCETQLNSLTNCGGCGVTCSRTNASATCGTGSCAISSCNSGFANCNNTDSDGCETQLNSLTNCGGCGVACSRTNASATCGTGSCAISSCNSGFGNCNNTDSDGCETQLNSLTNCGGCGVACSRTNATPTCGSGSCAISFCDSGFGNCDNTDANGCETSLNTVANCGGCGATCNLVNATPACNNGTCVIQTCNQGFADCNGIRTDGCEAPLNTLTNCGGCGVACSVGANATASCSTGTCAMTCSTGFYDCDGQRANGCESSIPCGLAGTGADGNATVAAAVNLTTNSIVGRPTADGVTYSVTSLVSAGATSLPLNAAPTGIAVGDEILVIDLQGTAASFSTVGTYEFRRVTAVGASSLTVSPALSNGYDGLTHKIAVQRVPNYKDVTINSSGSLTAAAWNGTTGGVLAFRCSGTLTVNGTISMAGAGYRGGPRSTGAGQAGRQGESINGAAFATSTAASATGGGGGINTNCPNCHEDGGGGGYGSAGGAAHPASGTPGAGGGTSGAADLSLLQLGGAGGSGYKDTDGVAADYAGAGGRGGGIVYISANKIVAGSGTLTTSGTAGENGFWSGSGGGSTGGGGGGAGGSLYLSANSIALGTATATGGTGGLGNENATEAPPGAGNGGNGRVRLDYVTLTGNTNPVPGFRGTP